MNPVCATPPRATPVASVGSNSTPIAERGSYAGTVNVGQSPVGVAADPTTGWTYVTNYGGGTVSVLNGTTSVATVAVGSAQCAPFGVAYDPFNGLVYVSDSGTGAVAVLRGTQVVTTLLVQPDPRGIAVDPGTGLAYVAEYDENNLTILNGTSVLTTVPAGTNPDGVAYSAANGDVYVTDYGGNLVTVFNGTTRVARIAVGGNPTGVAVDPTSGYTFVADSGSAQVSTINGLYFVQNLSVQLGPDGVAYDGANGLIYVTNQGNDSVSVLNTTRVLATIGVGAHPEGDAYDPANGMVYVADYGADDASRISTLLGIAPPIVTDLGREVQASDVAQALTISSYLWAPGQGTDVPSDHVHPSPGFGCGSAPTLTSSGGGALISIGCTPTTAGTYSIWLNVTDQTGAMVWSTVSVPVAPALVVPPPNFTGRYLNGVAAVDANQSIGIVDSPSGGSGVYVAFSWSGLSGSVCQSLATARPTCRFPNSGTYQIGVQVNDSNGATAFGPTSPLHVFDAPLALPPTANRTSLDVNEPVRFFAAATGGPGSYTYQWSGLGAGSCTSLTAATPACSFGSPGLLTVSVGVTDSLGSIVVSPTLSLRVLPLPVVAAPSANRTFLDVGQSIAFTTSASGGFGNYSYAWQGLPPACQKTSTTQPVCTATTPGNWVIWPEVLDGNGGVAQSLTTVSIAVYPDPTLPAPGLTATHLALGGQVTISADPSGGSGSYSFNWSGLPPGCAGRGETVRCTPSEVGTFTVTVTVRDSSGLSVHSSPSNLTVSANSLLPQWLPLYAFVALIVTAALTAVLIAAIIVRRRRRRAMGSSDAEADA